MSDKVVVQEQEKLFQEPADLASEIKAHIIKSVSVLGMVTESLEAKVTEDKADIANELNSLTVIYDQLEHAFHDANEIEKFLDEQIADDQRNS